MGEINFGKCEVCGKEGPLERTYLHYPIKCQCHGPNHFEAIQHCKDCVPKQPRETKVTFATDKLANMVIMDADEFEHLLNCMCNQKFIGEQKSEMKKEWQDIIDKAYHRARGLLSQGRKTQ